MVQVAPGSLLVHMVHWCKQQLVNAGLQHTERFTTLSLRFLVAERVDARTNVTRLGDDAPPFLSATMSKACRVFYTRSVDTNVSDQSNISPVEDLLRDACAEPTQKKMSSGAPFYIYERKDPTIYASAIMTIDTFSYKKPQ
jgi:hypothetical protein